MPVTIPQTLEPVTSRLGAKHQKHFQYSSVSGRYHYIIKVNPVQGYHEYMNVCMLKLGVGLLYEGKERESQCSDIPLVLGKHDPIGV